MPGYIEKALHKLKHSSPLSKHNSPPQWRRPQFSSIIKYAPDYDTTSELENNEETKFQKIFGTQFFYSRAVDCTMLISLNTIVEQQSKPT